jgi:hypothetical protein
MNELWNVRHHFGAISVGPPGARAWPGCWQQFAVVHAMQAARLEARGVVLIT